MTAELIARLREHDILHRLLQKNAPSQPSIGPVFGDSVNLPDFYYVDSGNGNDGNDGRDPAFPLATIDAAINKCTASQGDIILVQPGHSETLTAAIELDVIGVQVIGVGEGNLRPQITLAADDNGIEISAANCRVENIYFNERTTTPTGNNGYIDVSAANAKILNCHFDCGAEDLDSITLALNADSCEIGGNRWVTTADGPDSAIRIEAIIDLLHVHHNIIDGGTVANGFDEGSIVSGSVHTNCIVEYNTFHALVSGFGLTFTAAATGVIQYNVFALGTLGSMLDPGSCMCIQNFEQDAVDESGILVPSVNPAGTVGGGAHGAINDITTDGMHGKLGTDTEMSDRSIWDMLEGDGFNSWPAGAAYANDVSIAEVLAYIQDGVRRGTGTVNPADVSLYDLIGGTKGHPAWPTAAAYTNDVSLMEVVGYIQDQIRPPAGDHIPGYGIRVSKTDVNVQATTDDIFTITGLVMVTLMIGEVTAAFDGTIGNFSLRIKTSNEPLCAATSVTSDLVDTLYMLTGQPNAPLNGGIAPTPHVAGPSAEHDSTVDRSPAQSPMLLGNASGSEIVEMLLSAADAATGALTLTCYYIPLEASASVVAA